MSLSLSLSLCLCRRCLLLQGVCVSGCGVPFGTWEETRSLVHPVTTRRAGAAGVVQGLGEALPDHPRDKTEAGAVEITSTASAGVPVLEGSIHGVTLEELLFLVFEGAHARVHVALCVVSEGQGPAGSPRELLPHALLLLLMLDLVRPLDAEPVVRQGRVARAPEHGAAGTAVDRHVVAGLRVLRAEGQVPLTEVTGSDEACFDGVRIVPQLGGRLFRPAAPLLVSAGRKVRAWTRGDVALTVEDQLLCLLVRVAVLEGGQIRTLWERGVQGLARLASGPGLARLIRNSRNVKRIFVIIAVTSGSWGCRACRGALLPLGCGGGSPPPPGPDLIVLLQEGRGLSNLQLRGVLGVVVLVSRVKDARARVQPVRARGR